VIIPRSHIAFLLGDGLKPFISSPRRILDICTGSGCLAILAALAYPRARVYGSDISGAALAVAGKNVAKYRLQKRVRLVRSDLLKNIDGEFDLILTNPPYVPAASMRKLPPEYRHEPGTALAAGRSGLEFVSRILKEAPRHLSAEGLLVCEVGEARRALERAYPALPFIWAQPSVFLLAAAALA
jgi:ribosomal protein L3 glutamine methyltransferase